MARRKRINIKYRTLAGELMQIVHHVAETGAVSNKLFNAAHVYSTLNRKMLHPVDKNGNAQMFHLQVEVQSASGNKVTLSTANTGYVTKQAIKAWYKVWRKNLRDAGISMKDLGPYGSAFKPRFQYTEDLLGDAQEQGRGEWNYSDIVQEAPAKVGNTNAIDASELSDQYKLHMCGSTVAESGTDTLKFDSVGMIESWLGSRKSPLGGASAVVVPEELKFDDENPLILARGNSSASERLLDEVRDLQSDEPPYEESYLDATYTQGILRSNADLSGVGSVMAPCGHLLVTTTAACDLIFTLQGITPM